MHKLIEELRKSAKPVDPKCQGNGLDPNFLSSPVCSKIAPMAIFDIIDEETGQVDDEVPPKFTIDDPACRCSVYYKPSALWNRGRCPLASHWHPEQPKKTEKVRVGQQKQKKTH